MEYIDMGLTSLTADTRLCPRSDVMACQLGEGSALLDTRSGIYFQLNDVGAFVWDALDGRTAAQVAGGVISAYDIAPSQADTVHADVLAVLYDLLENGLVIADDATSD